MSIWTLTVQLDWPEDVTSFILIHLSIVFNLKLLKDIHYCRRMDNLRREGAARERAKPLTRVK